MSRYYFDKKQEADDLRKIQISWLKKKGLLRGYVITGIEWTSGWAQVKSSVGITICAEGVRKYIRLRYIQTESNGDKKDFDYEIPLATTSCHFGGERYWFVCPLSKNGVYCGRRAGVLYQGGGYFGCRHCYELTYESRNTNRNYKHYPLFRAMDLEKKSEELSKAIKRSHYAGKPTRKQKRLNQINLQLYGNYYLLKKRGDI